MRVIPAIDILDGKVVRLRQGNYEAVTVYHEDPVALAAELQQSGIEELHVIDLGGAKAGKPCAESQLRQIASLGLQLQVGGGIRSVETAEHYLEAGVKRLILSSAPFRQEGLWSTLVETCGAEHLMLSLDVASGRVMVNGWLESTGLTLQEAIDHFDVHQLRHVIVTDTARDGMLEGVNSHLYAGIAARYPQLKLYAAGGVDGPECIEALQRVGVSAAIVGRAFYERPEWLRQEAKELLC